MTPAKRITPDQAVAYALAYAESERARRENARPEPVLEAAGFTTLGGAIAGLNLGGIVPVAEPSADDLRRLPPTDRLDAALADAETALRRVADTTGRRYQQAERALRLARRDHDWGQRRDAIVAAREVGCACYGDGRIVDGLISEAEGYEGGEYTGRGLAVRLCPCEAGDRLRDERAERIGLLAAERARVALDATFDEQVARELGGYDRFDIASYLRATLPYGFEASAIAREVARQVREYVDAEDDVWLLLWGPAGTGKTAFAVWVMGELARRGKRGRFTTAGRILEEIQASYGRTGDDAGPRESEVMDAFRTVPVLVIDDFGVGKAPTPWAEGKLFEIINARYLARLVTVLTTNLQPEPELWAYVGDRISSRIEQRTDRGRWVVECNGPDLRSDPELPW